MWLTDGFSVTFYGRWWGAVCVHISHIQLLYTVINMHSNMQGGSRVTEPNIEKIEKFGIFKLQ